MPDTTIKILVAPLDWGLGHATRMVPVIDALIARNVEVHLGGSGRSLDLLRETYPDLTWHTLPSYTFEYRTKGDQAWAVLRRLPRFLATVREENEKAASLIKRERFHAVISDNRYGLFSHDVPSVIVCHQIAPIPPKGWRWTRPLVTRLHRRFLSRFEACWIPDEEGPEGLAGSLTSRKEITNGFVYIGILSRFSGKAIPPRKSPREKSKKESDDKHVLAILSGPEPHRGLFERMLLEQSGNWEGRLSIVRGMPDDEGTDVPKNVSLLPHATTEQLKDLIAASDVVISRPGYSSLMDYSTLGIKNVVLVPTPGQSEQVYLGERIKEKAIALVLEQERFSLSEAVRLASDFFGFPEREHNGVLESLLDSWLAEVPVGERSTK